MTTSPTPAAEALLAAELEGIVDCERAIRAAQSEQLRRIERARVFAEAVEGVTDGSSSADREFAMRSFVAELATTLVVHEATAGRLVAEAMRLTRDLTPTLSALADGSIGIPHVRSLLEVASSVPADGLAAFEAEALDRAGRETPSAFRRRIRRLRDRMHPEPLTARHDRARDERRVCLEPAEDGMAWLSLHLEAERGVAIMARLDAIVDARSAGADDAAAPSDSRTRAQRKLDAAADLLLGRALDGDASPLGVVTPRVYVTVPVLSLLGHTDEPAELDGHGPIDAATARRLAAHAPSFRRILTHPQTGAFLSLDRTTYRVPADLAEYLRIRDEICRFPGCSRRAVGCDIDHTRDWAKGGTTCQYNLAHLCRKHHRLKHQTRWRMSQGPGGDIQWRSPAGREYLTNPDQPFRPARPPDEDPDLDLEPPWAAERPAPDAPDVSTESDAPDVSTESEAA